MKILVLWQRQREQLYRSLTRGIVIVRLLDKTSFRKIAISWWPSLPPIKTARLTSSNVHNPHSYQSRLPSNGCWTLMILWWLLAKLWTPDFKNHSIGNHPNRKLKTKSKILLISSHCVIINCDACEYKGCGIIENKY